MPEVPATPSRADRPSRRLVERLETVKEVLPMVLDRNDASRRVQGWDMTRRLIERQNGAGFALIFRQDVAASLQRDEKSADETVHRAAESLRNTIRTTMARVLANNPG